MTDGMEEDGPLYGRDPPVTGELTCRLPLERSKVTAWPPGGKECAGVRS